VFLGLLYQPVGNLVEVLAAASNAPCVHFRDAIPTLAAAFWSIASQPFYQPVQLIARVR
jgi:hypothetical protein